MCNRFLVFIFAVLFVPPRTFAALVLVLYVTKTNIRPSEIYANMYTAHTWPNRACGGCANTPLFCRKTRDSFKTIVIFEYFFFFFQKPSRVRVFRVSSFRYARGRTRGNRDERIIIILDGAQYGETIIGCWFCSLGPGDVCQRATSAANPMPRRRRIAKAVVEPQTRFALLAARRSSLVGRTGVH